MLNLHYWIHKCSQIPKSTDLKCKFQSKNAKKFKALQVVLFSAVDQGLFPIDDWRYCLLPYFASDRQGDPGRKYIFILINVSFMKLT